jgi:hypothetical protein
MNFDPRKHAIDEHKRWLGYLQPEGVVVSAVALVDHGVQLDASTFNATQEQFIAATTKDADTGAPVIQSFAHFARSFLGWRDDLLKIFAVEAEVPDALRLSTGESGELLYPDAALRYLVPADAAQPWMLLIRQVPFGTNLDAIPDSARADGWVASPTQKFERLLRGVSVPIGIITNGSDVRLIYVPRGENAGSLTFPVRFMTELAGRAVASAFEMLLSHRRLISVPEPARLPALLKKSREYQSAVSTVLAEQVLESLYELLRGFQTADQQVGGKLLRDVLARNPDEVYHGLLNVLLRLVFLLFAEDRGVMPDGSLYQRNYSVHGLFTRLRSAYERYPDTMDSRFGAWAQLLALFRLVHSGCKHPELTTPARHGNLFDFNRFPFLEGRATADTSIENIQLPLVSDGVIYRVLEKLLILDGERLSYRTLDVEEIGSVYQTIMGFRLQIARGNAIALKGKRKKGGVPAAPVINLDDLLGVVLKDRGKWLKENADTELNGEAEKNLKTAQTVTDLLAALDKRIDRQSTPMLVRAGGLVLQPTDERRRSGSHYTPRSFTRPIVKKTLEPILNRMGRHPKPEEILALKICDLAVGSAAFLVETCRQLAEELIASWHVHKCLPVIPPDEDEILHAMRMIAQRCLYGVDRNPMATDLAKLSLWLATLAKDHPFTFLDHAIRCGDALVGLTRQQIEDFTWRETRTSDRHLFADEVRKRTAAALRERQALLGMGDDYGAPQLKHERLEAADERLGLVRLIGDAVVAAFFSADNHTHREAKRVELADRITDYLGKFDVTKRPTTEVDALREGPLPVLPFHWQIEFPEIFDREKPGFDAIVGNPPYGGKNTLIKGNRASYLDWLKSLHEQSHGNADLVAHFFRRAFELLRNDGCAGLIATKTVYQGDTRQTGLTYVCTHGGTIYGARKRYRWPGQAAVIVSVIWFTRGELVGPFDLDGRLVSQITAFLFHTGPHGNPAKLKGNSLKSFVGSYVLGLGFTFDDHDNSGAANRIEDKDALIANDERNAELIFRYANGDEILDFPSFTPKRWIFSFFDWPRDRDPTLPAWQDASAQQRREWLRDGIVPSDYPGRVAAEFPALLQIAESKVKGTRASHSTAHWWHFERARAELYRSVGGLGRVVVRSLTSVHFSAFTFLPGGMIYDQTLIVFAFSSDSALALLSSRVHEAWALFLGGSMGDTPRYNPEDCFETFPFPVGFETIAAVEEAGQEYYEFRAALMARNNQGLTKTYNRFHDRDERDPDILRLRELHAQMDRAVLAAYGWLGKDGETLQPADEEDGAPLSLRCEFIPDYVEETAEGELLEKCIRYRWTDDVRDEVLARLLKLNAERAEAEREAAEAEAATQKSRRPRRRRKEPAGELPAPML